MRFFKRGPQQNSEQQQPANNEVDENLETDGTQESHEHAGPGHHGHRPAPEDLTQSSTTNEDGDVVVTLTATDHDGEEHTREITVADNEDGGIDISSSKDDGGSKTVTISADEDGGVDIDVVCINSEGESSTRHIELDMNDDGTISFEGLFSHDGEEKTVEKTLELEHFLGSADEELTVAEVVEAHLERAHIDTDQLDLSGLSNLDGFVDLLIV